MVPGYGEFIGRLTLEFIAVNSDAPYHDLYHTIMVTDVGQAVLGASTYPKVAVGKSYDWLHFVTALRVARPDSGVFQTTATADMRSTTAGRPDRWPAGANDSPR